MKKTVLSLTVVAVLGLSFVGCSSKNPEIQKEDKSLPEWIVTPPVKEYSAVGSSKITASGLDYAESIASTNAKAKISKSIETDIKTANKSFTREISNDKGTTSEKVTQETIREVSANALKGARVTKKHIQDDYMYVMVEAKVSEEFKGLVQDAKEADAELTQLTKKDQE